MKTNRADEIRKVSTRINAIEETLNELKDMLAKFGADEVNSDKDPQDPRERNVRQKIQCIMDEFDFDKVHNVMEFLDWKWVGGDCERPYIPTVDRLRDWALDLLTRSAHERVDISSGGFRAVYQDDPDNPNNPYIALEFILTDEEGFSEDDQ
mgnify:CR=1 FL=1